MTQALLAAGIAAGVTFVGLGLVATFIHRWRHGQGRRYLWGIAVAAVLVGVYEYLNYLGR